LSLTEHKCATSFVRTSLVRSSLLFYVKWLIWPNLTVRTNNVRTNGICTNDAWTNGIRTNDVWTNGIRTNDVGTNDLMPKKPLILLEQNVQKKLLFLEQPKSHQNLRNFCSSFGKRWPACLAREDISIKSERGERKIAPFEFALYSSVSTRKFLPALVISAVTPAEFFASHNLQIFWRRRRFPSNAFWRKLLFFECLNDVCWQCDQMLWVKSRPTFAKVAQL